MKDCLFCKMIRKEIQPKIEYEDDDVLIFQDINPQAPVHILAIPKKHIERIGHLKKVDEALIGKLIVTATHFAESKKWEDFRLVFNNGVMAGQTVFHIHLHLLSGRKMTWPPG